MNPLTPITRERHMGKRWRRYDSYAFTARRALAPLVIAELIHLTRVFPIAFVPEGTAFIAAVVLGLEPERNVCVAEDGRWLGPYVPCAFRGYPFGLRAGADNQQLLCIDESSGLVTDAPEDERFFDDDGTPSDAIRQVLQFLTTVEQNRSATASACAALQSADVLEPWPIALKSDQAERKIEGLYRVSETKLNALGDEAFLQLRKSGALPLAYAQLLSMQNFSVLVKLAAAREQRAAQSSPPVQLGQDLDLSWLNSDVLKL